MGNMFESFCEDKRVCELLVYQVVKTKFEYI